MSLDSLSIRLLTGKSTEIAELQEVFQGCAAFMGMFGWPVTMTTAYDFFHHSYQPPRIPRSNISIYGIYLDATMIGFAHITTAFPAFLCVRVGWFALSEPYRDMRYGTYAWNRLEQELLKKPLVKTLMLAVYLTPRNSLNFWKRAGFTVVNEQRDKYICPDGSVVVFEVMVKTVRATQWRSLPGSALLQLPSSFQFRYVS